MTPHATNTRHLAMDRFGLYPNAEAMFGIEQEFFSYER